ncbi:MAG: cysteine desulfurase [Spirochaetaceae bacterium]|jgi:cysteine desulfurase|nr:cysteine desulfurase [Spirochaetaceae bacterium]
MPEKETHVYLDYNATTPLRDEVRAAIIEDLAVYGNASSMHADGRRARARVEEARQAVGDLLSGSAKGVIFTSGGSESNNTVFQAMRRLAAGPDGAPKKDGRTGIITTEIEHPCVLNSARDLAEMGFDVTFLPVDQNGKVRMDAYRSALSEKTLFVSVMMANNEIGTIQDIAALAAPAREAGAFFHTDAVQAVGKVPVNVTELGVDYLTMSAHKIYGPKGVGALWVREGAPLFPLIQGGHQEDGYRAGTYNNGGILGFGTAAVLAREHLAVYGREMCALRNRLRDGLLERVPHIKINGHAGDTLPNTLNVSFPGAEGEAILLSLDLAGIEVSTGSACASGSLEPSHVLLAIGAGPEFAHGSIRFSLGWGVTEEGIDYVLQTLPPIIARLRAMSTVPA